MKCPRLGRLLVRRCDCEQCATHRRRVHARSVAGYYDALAPYPAPVGARDYPRFAALVRAERASDGVAHETLSLRRAWLTGAPVGLP